MTIYILQRLDTSNKWVGVDHSTDFQKMAKQCDQRAKKPFNQVACVIPRGPGVKHEVLHANCEVARTL